MFGLEGKRAIVTGASGGIGGAIAKALHGQGAAVALSGTRKDALEAVAHDLGGERTLVVPANLAEPKEIDALLKTAEGGLGGIDIIVNNAGLTRDGLAMRMSDADWQQVLDVNLTAAFRLSRAALRSMMKRRWGRIVGITSIVGVVGNPGQANYAASKAALIGFSKSLAAEVASRNITVNCVAPGYIATPMTDALTPEQQEKLQANIPAARLGTPDDVAAAVVYLASEEASYVTGQTLHVNGGLAMI